MIRKTFWSLGFVLVLCASARAQFYPTQYRPPHQNWQQLSTPHFRIVFPENQDSVAWKTARILENQYPKVQHVTGGSLSNFPVILTDYNDRSNGVVTSLHFRSEIDISPIKGKTLNPETGGWLENVVPHELVHAMQFNNFGGFGAGQVVRLFSPDMARSMHGASPAGVQEGLAVYYESESVTKGGGRGNYPYFYNQFNAVFDSPARWSMGQMVHLPAESRPFNRHYIGGYEFTKWLQDTYGPATSRDAIDFHIRWPFLGYGVALKHATGQWPGQLYNDFEADKKKEIGKNNNYSENLLRIPYKGAEIHRPKWLSDSTLIFHASFYNARTGFYRYNLENNSLKRLVTTSSISDYNYALSSDKQSIIYSYNEPDVLFPNAYKATLVQASLIDEEQEKLWTGHRLFAPEFSGSDSLFSLETYKTTLKLVKGNTAEQTNQSVNIILQNSAYQIISAAVKPGQPDSLAVIMNHKGNQGLWIGKADQLTNQSIPEPDITFADGSIFDPVWHPEGNRLLFSADFSGALQVYEYDLQNGSITQLTDAPYNAFEASYSPDGNSIAFIMQWKNEQLPVILSRSDFFNKTVQQNSTSANEPGLQLTGTDDSSWTQQKYAAGFSWLKPRTVLPAIEEVSGSDIYRIGVGLHSSDLLQQQSYSLEFTGAQERLWYNVTYQNKQFFPGLKARIYSRPSFRTFRFQTDDEQQFTQRFLRQERCFALSVPMQFTLEQNVWYSGLYIEPEIRQSQIRYFNEDASNPSEFSNTTIGNIFGQFSYKVQQNIRDVQPNSGLVFYSELEHYFTSTGLTLHTSKGDADLSFSSPTGLRGGLYGYIAPLRKWNQSLRLGIRGITQSVPVFDNQSIISTALKNDIFDFENNLLSFNTRYTVPLFYPDNGGFLVPLYLSNVYLAAFSDTVVDPAAGNWVQSSRTVIGGGIRVQFRISNLSFDIGAGIGMEPSRNNIHYFIGNF